MKQLLYIPNGNFMTFYITEDTMGSLEQFSEKWSMTTENVIKSIFDNSFASSFFERNDLPEFEELQPNHFEIVEQ